MAGRRGRGQRSIHAADLAAAARSDPERARLMVTQRIKAAIGKIGEANPALASHLRKNIRTGLFCRYEPEAHVVWQVLNRVITR